MSAAVLGAYLIGAAMGIAAIRHQRLGVLWPALVRAQILVAAVALSIVAAWRLTGPRDLLWPALTAGAFAVVLAVSYAVEPGPGRAGRSALRAWTAFANTSYFAIPVAGMLAGPAGVMAAVLVDRIGLPVWSLVLWMMRRDAPVPQRVTTSWIDQSPLLAFGVGLLLKLAGDAPGWTMTLSVVFAPVLAGTGAAVFVGSVLHASQRIDGRTGVRPWARLVAVRLALLGPLAVLAPSPATGAVIVLCALSIPAFGPSQMSTVYGYADTVVAASTRYGWPLGAVGLVVAWAMAS